MKKQYLIHNKPFFVLTCVLQMLYGVISMCAAVLLNNVAVQITDAATLETLLSVGVPAILFAVVYGGSRAVSECITQRCAEREGEKLRSRLCQSVFSMNHAEFSKGDSGEYLNVMSGDVLLLKEQYYSQLPALVGHVAQFICCVAYSVYLNPAVALVLIAMSAVQYFAPMLFGKRINELTAVQSKMSSAFLSKTMNCCLGFP